MTTKLFRIITLTVAAVILSKQLSAVIAPLNQNIIQVAQIDWCPQICPKGKPAGYIVDIVKTVFKDSPYKLEFQTLPWSRAIIRVRTGAVTALLSPAKKEAPDLLFPKEAIGLQRMCFYVQKGSKWKYTDESSLAGLQIGIATDTSIEELNNYIKKHPTQFHYMPYTKDYVPLSLRMLDIGRFDAFIFTYNSTKFTMRHLELENRIQAAGCVSSAPLYMAFSPKTSEPDTLKSMMAFYDQRMEYLKKTGVISDIMASYGLPDWTKTTP
tara:strand:+ start:521 stop:1324 length:804 start_codon:yes stop_codon:yes gene_type:complete